MQRLVFIILFMTMLMACSDFQSPSYSKSFKNYNVSLGKLIDSLELQKQDLSLFIDKSDFELAVKSKDQIIKEYPIVLGTNPIDDKLMQGDRCTPEGNFQVRDFYPHQNWSKFIWINYPTEDSWKKHNQAKEQGDISSEAQIGGEIGIHGTPEGRADLISDGINWTWGCISLSNEDVDDLYISIHKKMDIVIQN